MIHGDAMEVLPTISGADLLLTDPPYRLTSGGKSSGKMGGIFSSSVYKNDGGIVECTAEFSEWLPLAFAALADDADAYAMANDKNQFALQAAMTAAGFKFHNLLVWDKVSPVPNRWYMKNLEFTVYGWKGKARTIKDPALKQYIRCPQVDVSDHPTEKPVSLMKMYIRNSTDVGNLVIDPFMGSGTTGVAAVNLGRRFIGIEMDKRWFEVACQRISDTGKNPQLFADDARSTRQRVLP